MIEKKYQNTSKQTIIKRTIGWLLIIAPIAFALYKFIHWQYLKNSKMFEDALIFSVISVAGIVVVYLYIALVNWLFHEK